MRLSVLSLVVLVVELAAVGAKVQRVAHPRSKQATRVRNKRPGSSHDPSGFTGTGWAARAPSTDAPKANVWDLLSNDEAADVIAFLHKQDALNLTAAENGTSWDNTIQVVDTLLPNKTAVLPYLSGNGSKPDRYAKAIIWFGASEEPWLQEFQVGPLPISNTSTYTSLDWATTKGKAVQRNYNADEDLQYEFFTNVSATVQDILTDLINGTASGTDDDNLDIWGVDPAWHPDEYTTLMWVTYWRIPESIFDGETLLPQGIFLETNVSGRDPSLWSALGWFYANTYYNSTESFRAAWEAGELPKLESNLEGDWIGSDYMGPKTEGGENSTMWGSERAPPLQVPVGGAEGLRYKVDIDEKYVEWMDFSFYLGYSRDTGLRLFDIKYRGERIVYELGLEEAIAHYAGADPVQSGVAYLDTYYGFGPYAFELLAGYDCPTHATFLNTSFHASEISRTHPNSICLFEYDTGYLIQRHSNEAYVSGTKNIAFVVRSVSTVGNYDYNFDYTFYLDGSIEVTVRASGYIQSTYYYGNEDYGYKIRSGLSGSMHDHCLLFKADIDILGTANSIANHTVVPVKEAYPWSHGVERSTMKLERSYLQTEDEGKIQWTANAQTMLMVVNQDEENPFGEPRGYRIMPGRGSGMHLTITESSDLLASQSFATHQLYATVRKDTEPRAAHSLNGYDVANPVVNFGEFLDGESLVQEDVVLWFNLGMHHVPHTGDLPNTVFTTAQGSMMILPHNYLLHDPSRDSRQTVRVDYNNSGVQLVNTFGSEMSKGGANLTAAVPDFWAYRGDISVRKFPYDPQHPYNDTESIV
ncbi:copper amine oxidase [Epithele typhae]|uniref:copper amine oxidase n=1 Tax=Epithele typhae TaxID=378194 RepID=UPI00200754DE|nr:copper amine oxidase [Epithele typhae]KAH9915164.1 copper amine oxidase [Epithele typhae]